MDNRQILDAYIDEYFVRKVIKVAYEENAGARLELPDRIIHLSCNERGIVAAKTHKRRGIPFMEHPVGIRVLGDESGDENEGATQNDENSEKRIVSSEPPSEEMPGQISIADLMNIKPSDVECNSEKRFTEGTMVASIYNSAMVFRVKTCRGNLISVFDEKTSTSHQIAAADLVEIITKEPDRE